MSRTLAERFMEKFEPEPLSGCWLWTGAHYRRDGRGVIRVGNRMVMAYRVAYELFRGPIPDGLDIDHLCRVPACINPDHLEPVSSRVNTLRGKTPAAVNAAKTHCASGHPYEGDNLYLYGPRNEWRRCRACNRNHKRAAKIQRGS